ncbi:Predicted kinase, aminoglycoside phosphotransferase (APT) family [Actinopolymorpha cephalotaxi]|uniref:Aminoglycoside phosphotransferase (APT) family kinase protein n=1 Tax=Actinopolymorpha cephalotaxi TaxID=504797 RepID=A0A1I2L9M9_9ACTN|nr:aminoglycoside phosphotransferase family protein [Actinopolymorpha cephalotaxi]NYH84999.1 aminoglycoside phosphotransferase (APT) family kinase protein [Actinopolymorpha cephalotaxi]SFF76014.1 Predicted kinase, aminoglycoside phosphotransferase (APT) family [Actinopolymorpha cephalotaxi]
MRKPDVDLRALNALLVGIFGSQQELSCRRTPTGSSTQVYRIDRGAETFYARIAEEEQASLAPEAELHRALLAAGVRVPAVVHYEPFDQSLARSVMVTTEVPGSPLSASGDSSTLAEIGRAAGRDLARIHGVPVHGFGWVRREHDQPGWPLRGEHRTYAEYVDPPAVAAPLTGVGLSAGQVRTVERLLQEAVESGPAGGVGSVAHGDFDAGHIFEQDGTYTGLIDFGEIRGTDYAFDFATICLNVEEFPPAAQLLRLVEQGYAEVRALPDDHPRRLYLACVLSAAHRLSTWYKRDGERAFDGWFFRWIRDSLVGMLESGRLPTAG